MDSRMHLPTEADIATARANIAGIARRTPLWRLDADVPGINVYWKLENLQPLGSFKIRAAVNAMKSKDPNALRGGVVGASAGNFGQGLAMVAQQIGGSVQMMGRGAAAAGA